MRLENIYLRNFKVFEESEFTLHPEFNLVVGVNGTGKSSLLDAISISLATWLLGFKSKTDTRGIEPGEARLATLFFDGTWAFDGAQIFDGRVRRADGEGKTGLEAQYPVEIAANGVVDGKHIKWSRTKESETGTTKYGDAAELISLAKESDLAVRLGMDDITLPLIACYDTKRLSLERKTLRKESRITGPEPLMSKSGLSRLEGYHNSVNPRISVKDMISWFALEEWAKFQSRSESAALNVVSEAIVGCTEGATSVYFDASLGELLISIEEYAQPFANLSDGQQAVLALVADIAQKAERLNPHLGDRVLQETPGVVLIDELDLHLHPKWQRRIIEDLRRTFPKIQFICTTHSPFLIQSLREGKLIQLDSEEPVEYYDQSVEDIVENVQGVEMPQKSKRYLDMMEAAEAYFAKLHEYSDENDQRLIPLRNRLDELSIPFGDDPAFAAVLKFERDSLIEKTKGGVCGL